MKNNYLRLMTMLLLVVFTNTVNAELKNLQE